MEGDNGINYAAAGVGPNFSSPPQPPLASRSRRDNSAATTAAGRKHFVAVVSQTHCRFLGGCRASCLLTAEDYTLTIKRLAGDFSG